MTSSCSVAENPISRLPFKTGTFQIRALPRTTARAFLPAFGVALTKAPALSTNSLNRLRNIGGAQGNDSVLGAGTAVVGAHEALPVIAARVLPAFAVFRALAVSRIAFLRCRDWGSVLGAGTAVVG